MRNVDWRIGHIAQSSMRIKGAAPPSLRRAQCEAGYLAFTVGAEARCVRPELYRLQLMPLAQKVPAPLRLAHVLSAFPLARPQLKLTTNVAAEDETTLAPFRSDGQAVATGGGTKPSLDKLKLWIAA